ncbi:MULTISPECIES: aminomethyl-transferring glycine dehydrogenase subunit GcvPB [unclassified Sedimentibacter]|uniref:aminomethyl-transferring glycine dehydrogenase subunit GcvPB n=1 Tax=unclassified Sedimentibacter TaxID=2649220 RepID=UPI0027DF6544|nr:aminomethyl-transferring glycine dehydrogenase subunit GcvPB [Sedimentibacter sp. MB35-C1]WMJ78295.1 aminomethyl-transferring glycine dehydrogenase subunit GcvPB [Sedimentibacter sp. MB35-C1]
MLKHQPLIFELSREGRKAYSLPECDVPSLEMEELIGNEYLREKSPELPEVSELDAVRHFTQLSQRNHGVDTGFYPLGSCTMKYNPKVDEVVARFDGFSKIHPYQPEEISQGAMQVIYELDGMLSEISGMDKCTLQPAAGAHGELTGLMIIKAYHRSRGDEKRNIIIIPDSAHGTNPASAVVAGFETVEVKSNDKGLVDLESLKTVMSDKVAGLMLTNPNTLGLFDENILKISEIVHEAGGLMYYDGANANAILGVTRPGDMGFDVVHFNIHKTFSTPHGGGGPGSGPVGVKEHLSAFLPVPVVAKKENEYVFDYDRPLSIGKVRSFYGNFGVYVKAYAYIRGQGPEGLRAVAENAVLNANYIASKLKGRYYLPVDRECMHECVLSGDLQKERGVTTLDIAKRLLDFGYHPPTVYFPLIVSEAMMIEPTECETKETLDQFIGAMIQIADEVENDPDVVKNAPHTTVVSRLNEAQAARKPVLRYNKQV